MKYTITVEDDQVIESKKLQLLIRHFSEALYKKNIFMGSDDISLENNNDNEISIKLNTDSFMNNFDIIKKELEKNIISRVENRFALRIYSNDNNDKSLILALFNYSSMFKVALTKHQSLTLLSIISNLLIEDNITSATIYISRFKDDIMYLSTNSNENEILKYHIKGDPQIKKDSDFVKMVIRDKYKLKDIKMILEKELYRII